MSVLLAVHNGAQYLAEAIRSVTSQTYPDWELIVVSNGSTDETARMALAWAAADRRVRVYVLPQRNKNAAYNHAFRNATGDHICFFAADDVLPPNSLERRVAAVAGADGFSTCCLQTFSENPRFDGIVFPRRRTTPNFSGGSILFSRTLAGRIFPLPEELPNEDTWAALHLRAFGVNRHVPEPLYWYRIHDSNSYGYGVSFEQKRAGYLKRMHAYQLFRDRYQDSDSALVESEVAPFLRALKAAHEKKIARILTVPKLDLRLKLVLVVYSSARLYRLRHTYFRTLSGIVQ